MLMAGKGMDLVRACMVQRTVLQVIDFIDSKVCNAKSITSQTPTLHLALGPGSTSQVQRNHEESEGAT